MTTFLGLLRDLIVAVVGLLIAFGVNLSKEQEAGILLVAATAVALGAWLYDKRQAGKPGGT